MVKRILLALAALLLVVAGIGFYGFLEARRDPVVRRAQLAMSDWPKGAPALRVVLMSDLHAGNLATDPARLARIVDQVNTLAPDLVLIAGDFTPGSAPLDAATVTATLAPLAGLRAPLGVVAVPGNHDHWTGLPAVQTALAAANVTLLVNRAETRGPLAIAGVDDVYSGKGRPVDVIGAARRLPGAHLVLTHSPDLVPRLPADFPLLLAGHTHCGQVVLPYWGQLISVSRYGERYRCGLVREGGRVAIVTAGIGGSVPFRLNAPPDLWLLTLGPAQ